jgi:hypothetical protein
VEGSCPCPEETRDPHVEHTLGTSHGETRLWWAVLLELPACEHQGTLGCAQIQEAATRRMVLTALAWVKFVNTWFGGSL